MARTWRDSCPLRGIGGLPLLEGRPYSEKKTESGGGGRGQIPEVKLERKDAESDVASLLIDYFFQSIQSLLDIDTH